ncbi:MAG: hypothetical protein K5900_11130 [Butyrivibrio sp.]|nr:hypothetical protein [Butyrivibrio sp.]
MVRKNLVKITSIALIVALAAGTVACGSNTVTDETANVVTQETVNEDKLEETMNASSFGASNTDVDKVETVYVMADNQGSVNEVIVSDWLKNADASSTISDASTLSDIVNVKGSETYTENEDGTITWNANGSDIYYQGKTDSEVPVSVKISYKLDGEDITPEELAGKCGNVTIRFEYTNNSKKTVEIDGEETEIYTPFAMVSGVMLDSSKFTNVEVTNGKVISDANNYVVMGVALPGLKDSLALDEDKLSELEIEDDINIPEYVEVTAYTNGFEMPMTLTMATSDALSDLGFSGISNSDGVENVKEDMDELQDGSTQLVDGSSDLYDGTSELKDGTQKLTDGAGDLKDGSKKLKDGIDSYTEGVGKVSSGAGTLDEGIGTLQSGVGTLATGAGELNTGISSAKSGADQLQSGASTAQSGASQVAAGAAAVDAGAGQLQAGVDKSITEYNTYAQIIASQYGSFLTANSAEILNTYGAVAKSVGEQGAAAKTKIAELMQQVQTSLETINALKEQNEKLTEENKAYEEKYGKLSDGSASDAPTASTDEVVVDENKGDNNSGNKSSDTSNTANTANTSSTTGATDENNTAGSNTTNNANESVTGATEDTKTESDDSNNASTGKTDENNIAGNGDTGSDNSNAGAGDTSVTEGGDSAKASITLNGYRNCDASETEGAASGATTVSGADAIIMNMSGLDATTWQTMVAATNAYFQTVAAGPTNDPDYATHIMTYAPTAATTVTLVKTIYGSITSSVSSLQTLSDGAAELKAGTSQLSAGAASLSTGLQTLYSGMVTLDTGLGKLATGGNSLVTGVGTLSDGVSKLKEGSSQLASGASTLDSNSQALKDGASDLYDGTVTLSDGTVTLNDGAQALMEGAKELSDGMVKFDEEGIQKLSSAFDGDIQSFTDRLQAIEDASTEYTTFSGVSDGSTSSVKFIIKTEGVEDVQ